MWQRKNKFNRTKVKKLGYTFDSKLESAVHDILLLREKAGEIKEIQQQINVHLTLAKILYKPDFAYTDCATGETIYVEAKGMDTQTWRIKLRLWKFYGPGTLEIWRGSYNKPFLDETVIPTRAE